MRTTTRTAGKLGVWAALVVAAVGAAIAVGVMGATLDAGPAQAATATGTTIEATTFTVGGTQTGEGFRVCPGAKRAVGGGVVQSGMAANLYLMASAPLDATGVTLNTDDRDVAKQWYAAVSNYQSGVLHAFKVFAICE